jgi:GMP synthase-like glutamine amidotransferase
MTRRIAILLTSNDESAFSRRFPNDGEKVRTLLGALRPSWTFDVWAVKDGEFPPDAAAADGWIVTGSPASVHDPLDWIGRLLDFIRELDARQAPLIGLCFGHQAVALALGGDVERSARGWRLGIATTRFSAVHAWMHPPQTALDLYASHCEQVTRLPPGAVLLGGDEFCPNAAFTVGRHILTTEYHPEFSAEFMQGIVDALEGSIPADVIERARQELRRPAHGGTFAQWMVRFLERPR